MGVASINITRKDIVWGYVAIVISLAAGLVTLPLILNKLPSEEVGLYYLMLSVSALVALLDFGFAPQFGRNFSYVHGGARILLKEGVEVVDTGEDVDYHLLAVLLKTAKVVYLRISILALALMLTFGTWYIYAVTDGFSNVKNTFAIWATFSVSIFFNVYYNYYISLLKGCGKMAESSIATILNKAANILLSVVLLLCGFGLFAVVIANLIAPFVQRFYTYKVYFTKDLKNKIKTRIEKSEITETFNIIWFNAKKTGIGYLGSYAIINLGTFLMGLFLTLGEVASYGLLIQLCGVVSNVSKSMFHTYIPKFNYLRVTGQLLEIKKLLSVNVVIFLCIMVVGDLMILIFGDPVLDLINSKTQLPQFYICLIVIIMTNLEANHTIFSNIIATKNEVPYVKASLISGAIIGLLTFLLLKFTTLGLWAVVLPQFIVQLCYNNWKWPVYVMKDLNLSIIKILQVGNNEIINKIRLLTCKK